MEIKRYISVFGAILFFSVVIFFISSEAEESRKNTEIYIKGAQIITLNPENDNRERVYSQREIAGQSEVGEDRKNAESNNTTKIKENTREIKEKGKEEERGGGEEEGKENIAEKDKIHEIKSEDILIKKEGFVKASGTEISLSAENIGWLEVQAEKSLYNMKRNEIELFGDVQMKSDKFTGSVRKAKIILDDSGKKVKLIEGFGDVFIIYGDKKIKSEKVNVIPERKIIVFSGNPEIQTGNLQAKGKTITIFLDSNQVQIEELNAKVDEKEKGK